LLRSGTLAAVREVVGVSPDIPDDEQCRMGDCSRRATEFDGPMPLCGACSPSGDTDPDDRAQNAGQELHGHARVATPSGRQVYPAYLRDQKWWVDWVLAKPFDDGEIDWSATPTKQPVAPYKTGHVRPVQWHSGLDDEEHPSTDFETVDRYEGLKIGLDVPEPEHVLSDEVGSGIIIPVGQASQDGRTVTLIDWDDVRDPETDEIHPVVAWALEECNGYAEISQSGEGIHQFVFGEIPGGLSKFIRHLDDEPFVGDDLPQVEMYQSGRLCAMTGRHVEGTGEDLVDGQDLLDELCWRFGRASNNSTPRPTDPFAGEREDADTPGDQLGGDVPDHDEVGEAMQEAVEYDGEHPKEWEYPDDWSLGYAAALRGRERSDQLPNTANWELIGYIAGLGHRDGRTKHEVIQHLEDHPTPQYGFDRSRAEKEVRAIYRKGENGNYNPPTLETLAERGLLPEDLADERDDEAVSALPIRRLQTLDRDEAKRYARKHGHDWPSTDEVRRRLKNRTLQAMRNQERVILDSPTGSGKSYGVATHHWTEQENVTGGAPVIQFHETREARDQAFQDSQDHGGRAIRILGRTEACPCAAGEHDPATDDEEDEPEKVVTVDDTPASVFLERLCEGKGLPFSVAHTMLREHHDQQRDDLPCEEGEGNECHAIAQWHGVPRTEDGEPAADVIHCTHQFAHVPSLRKGTNMVFDERPDFRRDDLSQDRIRRAITAFLNQLGDEVRDYEHLITLSRDDDVDREWVDTVLRNEPDREWYLNDPDAHTLAPALARAIFHSKDQPNGRRAATVPHEPPRLDAEASDDDGWNREWVSVVLDTDNTIRTVRSAPGMTLARSVIGLDAHPTEVLWQRNTAPSMVADRVLDPDERRAWRLFERGLTVVQVGEATRPVTTGEYFDEGGARVLLQHLREEYGDDFRTAITSAAVEDGLADLMGAAGVDDPETMHYGEEKSRGDFGDEDVGYLEGCIDPGDGMVLDLLAEADLDAEPETAVNDEGEEYRAHGRGFTGDDADTAAAILASVREQHVAQAAGRYARNAQDPDDTATVFVRTSAVPEGFADLKVPGVEWRATEKQAKIFRALRDRPTATAAGLAEAADVSKEHVRKTLAKAVESGAVERRERAGDHGADVYRALAGVERAATGAADLKPETVEITNDPTRESYTWSLAIVPPHVPLLVDDSGNRRGFAPPEVATVGRQTGISDFDPT
jgi:hypothetical protein